MAVRKLAKKTASAGGAERIFEITDPAQLEAVVSTRRRDIIDQVCAFGPMSVREIAAAIGAAPSALYYHIEQLCEVGLLREAGLRHTGAKPEQLYAARARRMHLLEALQAPRNKKVLIAIVAAICAQTLRDFKRSFEAPQRRTSGPKRNARFGRVICRPDAEALAKINAHLDAITDLISASASTSNEGCGERLVFTWVVSPLRERGAKK